MGGVRSLLLLLGLSVVATVSAQEAVAPTAHAGPDQTVSEGAVVTLDGAASSSSHNEPLRYAWRQTGGATVALRDAAARSTTFLAPTQLVDDETLEFALVVTDVRGLSSPVERQLVGNTTNTVVITVRAGANDAPMVDAGSDVIAGEGDVVTLRGVADDPEGEELTYRWRQTSGTVVGVTGATSETATFLAPQVVETLGFELTVADARGATGVDTMTVEVRDRMDYDVDDDTLIEVATTSQLAAIRYDLGGAGLAGVSSTNEAAYRAYRAAFPLYDEMETCPGTCAGYELSADLDLSSVNPAPGAGWTPLGGEVSSIGDLLGQERYTAVFEGNGHVISNLRMVRDRQWHSMGLFGAVGADGRIRNVGLRNAQVSLSSDGRGIGALVGFNLGEVAASYVIGGRIGGTSANFLGGLIGDHRGRLVASYAAVDVHSDTGDVGGLVGRAGRASVTSASYFVGTPTGSAVGGLIGRRHAAAVVESSYFDGQRNGLSSCCGRNPLSPDDTSRTSRQLRAPTTAAGTLYEGWDKLNVDRVDQGGDGDFNDDSPWDFGTAFDYPVLVFGGATETQAARRTLQQEAQPEVSLAPTLIGNETVSEGGVALYVVRLPEALPAGVNASWDWSVGGEVNGDDFVGATIGSVTIESGQDRIAFLLTVRDDADAESFETMVVALSNARLAGAGVPARGVRLGVPAPVRTVIDPSDGVEKDYDVDGDTLIEVATTSQLAAIRHDLDGAGLAGVSSANEAAYRAYRKAFPFFDEASCPRACTGYELSADLDLSGIADWTPLGGGDTPDSYTAVFEGNGHVISDLRMSGGGVYGTGLFGSVGADGRIRNVGLRNAQVAVGHIYVGALVGRNRGKVAASYVSGGRISGSFRVGGLIGGNDGRLVASYADVEVHASIGEVGGLVGEASVASVVSASYSVGKTTGTSSVGGLIGRRVASAGGGQFGVTTIAAVESSYFDKERSLRSSCCGTNAHGLDDVVAKTSSDMILPITATGTIYAGWDKLNVDDVDQGGDGDYNDDAPWDFGSAFDYPVLVFGGATETEVARRTSQQQAQPEVSLTPTLAGSEAVSEGGTASYVVRFPGALPAGVTASWNWAVGGNQVGADDFDGTTGSVVIASGASSASFSVRVRDDIITELSEVMVVALSDAMLTGAPARVGLGVPLPVSTAINPSDGVGRDYDLDDDTLIEVATTSQLAAIRHDLGGVGLAGVSGDANRAVYLAAFPFFEQTQTCPGASCTGYELSADLDLSSIPDWTPIGGGGSDEIPNADAFPQDYSDCIAQTGDVVDQTGHTRVCWVSEETPPVDYYYTAVFEGNGHVISNLRMDRDGRWWHMGLFGAVNANGIIRNVGLRNARVSLEDGGSSYIGALVGRNEGKVAASYVSGGRISGVFGVGGLIGGNFGSLVASYADVEVHADGSNVGGLVGEVAAASVVSASYSIGETTGGNRVGGLIGGYDIQPLLLNYADVVQSSYFDGQRSGQSSCCGRNPPSPDNTSKTSAELFSPTTAAFTIYEGWEQLNVDDVDQEDDGDLNDDAPWDFGTVFDYPVLVFAGATETDAARRTLQQEAQPQVSLAPTLTGSETVSEGEMASYQVRLPEALPAGVSATWDWSVGGEVSTDDFVGATTGDVVIASGAVSASFSVRVRADGETELSEVMVVTLSNARLTGVPAHVGLGVPFSVRTTIEASDQIDYDFDGDTLIEVATTSQLAAIRYDLGGAGLAGVSGDENRAAYLAAFPFFDAEQTCSGACTGYELSADLDVSSVNPAPGAGWTPLGGGVRLEGLPGDTYTAVFEGNGHVISNLRVVRSGRWFLVGLFGRVGADGRVRNVGLRNAQIDLGRDSVSAGALVGTNRGKVAASYVSGGRISGGTSVGGLVGINIGEVVASYADVEVHAGGANAGGLVGSDPSEGAVRASYSIGRPTGVSANGLIGSRVTGSVVESSYFDKERSGLSSCCGRNSPDPDHTPRLSAELLFPTTATGTIYAGWDQLNVDDVDQGRDGDLNDDAPWDFGGVFDYPVLVFGGATETEAVRRTSQRQARPEVILTPTLAGSATGQEGGIASYVVRFSGALPAGVSASWNWSVGGGEVDADDFVGTTVGSVVIAAGAASASFVLRVRADGEIEMPEVMVVALSNARLAGAPQGVALGVPLPFRTTIEFNDGTDYDEDDDGLIEVATTSQLAAIRYDLGGAGIAGVSSANKSAYFAAFPLFGAPQTCPSTCTGYELSSDLDLSGLNWTPLGGDSGNPRRGQGLRDADYYSAVFEGNGHVISNLTMTRKGDSYYMGLFGAVSAGGVIRNVGLHNARVELAPFALGGGGDGGDHVGALVGRNEGKVAASYVIGGRVFGVETVGGLVGGNYGVVVASYADVEMYVESGPTGGGLIGGSAVGSVVSASYSVGATTGYIDPSNIARGIPSGLIGSKAIAAVVESSYFDTGRSGQSRCCGNSVPSPDNTPQTSNQLRAPTTAAGTIYAGWDQLNVDDVDQTGDDDLNDDAPWDFGTVFDYPVLVFGGATETMAMRRTSQQEAQPAIILAATLTGSVTVSEGEAASYVVSLPEALPTGASVRWDWVVGGDEVSIADFVGTTGVVVIGSGASSASFSVEVFDDTIPELSEVMVVTLSSAMPTGAPARARLGVPVSVRTTIEASDEIDYDDDNDGLIDVATTSQLAAIRYDLGGAGIAGVVGKANRLAYFAAFPVFDEKQTCPSTCTGYELSADLDLSSVEPAPGPGWTPIGGGGDSLLDNYYTAVFEGNGHVISNLRVARGGRLSHTGLFGAVSAVGTVRNVGLRNAWISLGDHSTNTGALVGRNEGKVVASYVSGGRISGVWAVGGLIGGNYGRLVASYADVEVHTAEGANAGGLVGEAGGASVVSASYSVGKPTGATAGGLIGNRMVGAVVESSYFDRERSGQSDCCGSNVPSPDNTSKTSNQLRAPTTATGTIYAGWSRLNVDGLDQGRDGDFNDDAPWDFGSVFDYPVLVFGGATDTQAARRTSQQQTQPEVDFAPTLTGSTVVAEGGTASYVVRLPGALPAGASARWSWAVGGEVDADDFVGTTAGSVVIAPGAASASFVLRVRADGVIEPPEVLAVTLSSARLTGAPADVRLGVPSTVARTTIAINDPITVAARSATVSEGTTATFTITLRGGGDRAVVVEYEITAVSEGLTHEDLATVNVEGRAASARSVGSLPFTGSVTLNEMGTATIAVRVASDQLENEERERFRLRLTGCPNCLTHVAELGTPSFADVNVRDPRSILVDARVVLQGALLPETRRMRSDLAGLLPRRQPYGASPWNYPATTTVPHVGTAAGLAGVTSAIVDWVLVELRTGQSAAAAASSRPLAGGRATGLLLSDGRIAGINEAASVADASLLDGVRFELKPPEGEDLYVLIHHRNHLPVMSSAPVVAATGTDCEADYCVDFRVGQSHGDGQVEMGAGLHAMVAGDLDRNGVIDERDEALIRVYNLTSLGAVGYRAAAAVGRYAVDADVDFDGEVLSADRYFVIENKGRHRPFSVR